MFEVMKFSRGSIILLLRNLKELRQGESIEQQLSYLERPLATGSKGNHAPYESPCLLIGELEMRLKKCGRDGFFLKVYYALEESVESLARALGLSKVEVERGILTALNYISYKWPKEQSYRDFRYDKRNMRGSLTSDI